MDWKPRCPRARATVSVALSLSAAVCVAAAAGRSTNPDAERWARAVQRAGVDPSTIEYPLRYSEDMRTTARNVAAGGGTPLERLRRLQRFLFDADHFPFDYDSETTFTAEQAFRERAGNCVSFTNLFIALGRSLRIPVQAALVTRIGQSEKEGDLIVVHNHIVAAYEHSSGATVFDFNRRSNKERVGLGLIDDLGITAVYVNNRGVQALLASDTDEALRRFEIAVKLAPGFTPAYGNLGVARRKLGDTDGALEAYRQALLLAPRHPTILNNLANLYQTLGRNDEARVVLRAVSHRGATPYLLVVLGDFERAEGNVRGARTLYKRATQVGRDIPDPWIALARLEIENDRPKAARRALQKAMEIDPDNAEALRLVDRLDGSDPGAG